MSLTFLHRLCIALVLTVALGRAQTFDAQFIEVLNNGVNYDVKIQIKANSSTFNLGTSNLGFTFNTADLTSPVLQTAHNFSGGNYQTMTIANNPPQQVVLNIELNTVGSGTMVPLTYFDVATIRFTVTDPAGNSSLTWIAGEPTVVFKDDESTIVPVGTLNNLNSTPLPVQLVYFTGSLVNNGRHVDLRWGTLTELNNYGFFVQKSPHQPDAYETIPHSFVPGHGTTLVPQHYAFTDSMAAPGIWYYRLKQVDLDGTIHYNEGIRVDIVTGVDDPAPREFALLQNYPNPFNPRAEIKFSVETTERARLRIYNLIGQHVATLFDDVAEAGRYYRVSVDGTPLASGMYFYKLETETRSAIRKMMLVK